MRNFIIKMGIGVMILFAKRGCGVVTAKTFIIAIITGTPTFVSIFWLVSCFIIGIIGECMSDEDVYVVVERDTGADKVFTSEKKARAEINKREPEARVWYRVQKRRIDPDDVSEGPRTPGLPE